MEPGGVSKCESEYLTIARSCEKLIEQDIEEDDLMYNHTVVHHATASFSALFATAIYLLSPHK